MKSSRSGRSDPIVTEEELLVDCLRRLESSGIDYMLVGSMAGNFWGVPRSTHDIDFVIEFDETQIAAIISAFQDDFFIQETRGKKRGQVSFS